MANPSSIDSSWFAQGHGGSKRWSNDAFSNNEKEKSIEWVALEKLLEGQLDRQQLLENALAKSKHNNERLLQNIKQRIDKVGIILPTVEVRFEHLTIDAEVYVGDRALPSLINFTRDLVENLLASCGILPPIKRPFTILRDISGVIKPGRMTLLLGPPGIAYDFVYLLEIILEFHKYKFIINIIIYIIYLMFLKTYKTNNLGIKHNDILLSIIQIKYFLYIFYKKL